MENVEYNFVELNNAMKQIDLPFKYQDGTYMRVGDKIEYYYVSDKLLNIREGIIEVGIIEYESGYYEGVCIKVNDTSIHEIGGYTAAYCNIFVPMPKLISR